MGMTWTQFWDEEPEIAVAYRKAYKLRRELDNENAWLQGLYVYDAFAVVLSNAFGKRGSTKHQYLEKPIDIFPLTESEKKRREQEEREKMMNALKAMQKRQQAREKERGD